MKKQRGGFSFDKKDGAGQGAAGWRGRAKSAFARARRAVAAASPRGAASARPLSLRSVAKPYLKFTAALATQPDRVFWAQQRALLDGQALWLGTWAALLKAPLPEIEAMAEKDARFRDPAWREWAAFNVVRQAYLLSGRWLQETISDVRGLDPVTRRRLRFFTDQLLDAAAPTNFLLSNPEALRATRNEHGRNLVRGVTHWWRDFDVSQGRLAYRMTDPDAFCVGQNIANTPGQVVYQNRLMQLIQYAPTTDKVRRHPVLVVPPWINKFYILDLGEQKSLVRYWLDHGHTVFMISWVNPDARHVDVDFEDYMREGPLEALDAIARAVGEPICDAVGYCIGGTLLAATLAWQAAHDDHRIRSATFLNTLLDFSDPGDLSVFVDPDNLRRLSRVARRLGYLPAETMATTFNMLRARSLVWSFVVDNYLLGRDPAAFDLLYWNADATRLPAAMLEFYLRQMYLHNRLRERDGITLADTPIDLRRIDIPCYFVAAATDHITPWRCSYLGAGLMSGPVRFVLSGSGHIAGIVNPPAAKKYGYRTHENTALSPESWAARATVYPGSWWPDWADWAAALGDEWVDAGVRTPGDGELPPLEPAPGSYVRDGAN